MMAKLELWGGIVLAVLAGIAVAVFYGYAKGKEHAAEKVRAAKQQAADAKATVHAHEVREHVETTVQQTPDAPAQKVASADSATAAGKLRTHGWVRHDRTR